MKVKEPFNAFSHFFGALLSITALVLLVYYANQQASSWHVVSFSIFGVSLILLYTASTIYHWLPLSTKGERILKRIDHMMIYILIAGSYTPICLIPLRGVWGWSLLISIWVIAILGIIMKAFWLDAPRWLSTAFYLIMGWLVVIAFLPMIKTIPAAGLCWLLAGGIFYTIGGVIYGSKKPDFLSKYLGFHEIFHLFVLAGSISHFWLMYRYILHLR
ncbi:PAQR family membrane homeostasis protein TrhA [Orenia marismortui]|uniref:Channel protein (Hemolysin III family) n=1 Tax=Orenia marismortui TaxID=46469 RepID=A0A4R8H9P1_9FIRM|nr:hemolysin III family protein [Orenia marismortui]TDX52338.1 channel protein (hemolysin III family) [Orenia marismortui]